MTDKACLRGAARRNQYRALRRAVEAMKAGQQGQDDLLGPS